MKVFVTVGSMLPFDRLIKAADKWAASRPDVEVVAQTGGGDYVPRAMKFSAMVPPEQYRSHCAAADVVVSHLGMGTVITVAELGKPLVALPRRRELGEVTSDHQTATATWLKLKPGVTVIESGDQLERAISAAVGGAVLKDFDQTSRVRLVACVRAFVVDAVKR